MATKNLTYDPHQVMHKVTEETGFELCMILGPLYLLTVLSGMIFFVLI
jgi:hypothetical protein